MTTHRTPEITEHSDEVQLETLLRGLLGRSEPKGALGPAAALSDIAELRDTARLLRAASQWVPLPEGRLAVKRALMAMAQQSLHHTIAGRAAWRRAGLWLSAVTALAAVVGAFGLGTGAFDRLVSPSGPALGVRLARDRARDRIIPGRPGPGAYALTFQFSTVQVPSAPGATARTAGKLGGLPATLSLTAASGCRAGAACGKFVVSVAGPGTAARAKVGEVNGTFACEAGGCILTAAQTTGVFARVSVSALSLNTTRPSVGQLGGDFTSFSEWMSVVTAASDALTTGGISPGRGVTDPARQGGNDGRRDHSQRSGTNQGSATRETKGGGSSTHGGTSGTGHVENHGPDARGTTKDTVHSGTSTGPGAADTQQGQGIAKDKDHPNATGGAPGNAQRDQGTPKGTDHPGVSSGTPSGAGGTGGSDKDSGGARGGAAGKSAGAGGGTGSGTGSGSGSATRDGTRGAGGGTGGGEHETERGDGTGRE